jgi:hypothetical protein
LSVDADHDSVIVVPVNALRVSELGADGAAVSAHAAVAALSVLLVETLPAASAASTPSVYVVPHVRPLKVYDVVAELPAAVPFLKVE